jgi:hypothetical protein
MAAEVFIRYRCDLRKRKFPYTLSVWSTQTEVSFYVIDVIYGNRSFLYIIGVIYDNESFLNVVSGTHGNRSSFTRDVSKGRTCQGKSCNSPRVADETAQRLREALSMQSAEVHYRCRRLTEFAWVSVAYSAEMFTYESLHIGCRWHRLWSRTTNKSNTISSVTFTVKLEAGNVTARLGFNDDAIFQMRKIQPPQSSFLGLRKTLSSLQALMGKLKIHCILYCFTTNYMPPFFPRREDKYVHETFISTCWWSGLCLDIINILLISPSINMAPLQMRSATVPDQRLTRSWTKTYDIWCSSPPPQATVPHTSFRGFEWRKMCMYLHCQLIFQRNGGKGLARRKYWIDTPCGSRGWN